VDGVERLLRRGRLLVRAHDGDAERSGVVAHGVRTDDGAVQATGAALPQAAVLVRQDVVAHVRPAAAVRVEAVDAAQDRRDVLSRVAVGTGRVVDDRGLDGARVVGRALPQLLVRAPRLAGADRGLLDLLDRGVLHRGAAGGERRALDGRVR